MDELFDRAAGVKRLLHGRLRSEFRKRMSEKVKQTEEMRQQGRLGYMFRMVNLREKQNLDLSVISRDGELFTNPVDIQITDGSFCGMVPHTENLHPVAQDIYHKQCWQALLDGVYEAERGPESFRFQEFSAACKYKASPSLRELFRSTLLKPISESELQWKLPR